MDLYVSGKAEEGIAILRRVAEEAEARKVKFDAAIARNLALARQGDAPLLDMWPDQNGKGLGASAKPAEKSAPKETPPAAPATPEEVKERPAARAEPDVFKAPVAMPALADPAVANKLVSVDFNQVDIRIVLKTVSDLTGVNFLIDDAVRGTVTIISPTKVRLADLYYVLEAVLETKNFAAVPGEHVVKVIPRANALKQNLITRVGSNPDYIPKTDTVVTQIMPLRYASANEVVSILNPTLGPGGNMAVYPNTNMILVTDTSSNIHHMARIVSELDVPGSEEETFSIPLKYASVETVAKQVSEALAGRAVTAVSAVGSPAPATAAGRGGAVRQEQRASTSSGAASFKVLSDTRTNTLIVIAPAKEAVSIRALVKMLDVERPRDSGNIHVVYLEHAQAKDVVKSLTAAAQNLTKGGKASVESEHIQITADEGTNSLIIIAPPQEFEIISGMIAKLDIYREQILVEMRIIEASQEAMRDIGVEWATMDPASKQVRGFGLTNFGIATEYASGDLQGLAVGAFKSVGGSTKIGAIIAAMESRNDVNILSTPHILTTNHQKAKITVGENRPFVKESRVTETDPATPTAIKTYEYKDVGVILEITPHVSQKGLTRLEIDSKFTKVIENTPGLSADTPTTAKREATTVVTVADGATVVIGGLIRDDKTTSVDKVPILGDIPWLGYLFRRETVNLQKTNLLFFITPRVLTDKSALASMTEARRSLMFPDGEPGVKAGESKAEPDAPSCAAE
ncbi:MAG TPA: type II secretion system secretin GspD [Candidatus Brocadiia bacterium]|nr:type II secretion system secretin GspD [Candidatus Brocadiia bacterium]